MNTFSKLSPINPEQNRFAFDSRDEEIVILGNEAGDPFIAGTMIEGHYPVEAYTRFKTIMKDFYPDMAPFEQALEWAKKICSITTPQKLRDLAIELSNAIMRMEIENELLLPAGWQNSIGKGHAIAITIKRLSEKRYAVTAHNTGEGLRFHSGYILNGEKKYLCYLTRTNIPINRLCNQEFLEAFLEMQVAKNWSSTNYDELYLYETWLPWLGGTIENSADYQKYPDWYQTPQRSGTCTMKSIFSVLRYRMRNDIPSYKRIKLQYRQKALEQSLKTFNEQGCRSTYKLISQIGKQQAKGIEKAYKKWKLNDETYQSMTNELVQFRKQLQECKQTKIDLQTSVHTDSPSPSEPSGIGFFAHRLFSAFSSIISGENGLKTADDDLQIKVCIEKPTGKIFSTAIHFSYSESFINPNDTATINTSSKHVVVADPIDSSIEKKLSTLSQSEIDEYVRESLELSRLPSPNDHVWDEIPENMIDPWIHSLSIHAPKASTKTDQRVKYFYCLAIADRLIRRHSFLKEKFEGFTLFGLSDLVFFAHAWTTNISKAEIQEMLFHTLRYFKVDTIDPARYKPEEIAKLDDQAAIDGIRNFSFSTKKSTKLDIPIPLYLFFQNSVLLFIRQFVDPTSDLKDSLQICYLLTNHLPKHDGFLSLYGLKAKNKLPKRLPDAVRDLFSLVFKQRCNQTYAPYTFVFFNYFSRTFHLEIASSQICYSEENAVGHPISKTKKVLTPLTIQPQNLVISQKSRERYDYAISFTPYERVSRAIDKYNNHPISFTNLSIDCKTALKNEVFDTFFQGPFLFGQILHEPRTALQLLRFVDREIKKHRSLNETWTDDQLEHTLFFADLGIHFVRFIDLAMLKSPNEYKPFKESLDSLAYHIRNNLRDNVLWQCDENQKVEVINILTRFYADNLHKHLKNNPRETLKDILLPVGYARADRISLKKILNDSTLYSETDLNGAISNLFKVKFDLSDEGMQESWKKDGRWHCFTNGVYSVDLLTGEFFYNSQLIDSQIPPYVLAHLKSIGLIDQGSIIKWTKGHTFELQTGEKIYEVTKKTSSKDFAKGWSVSQTVDGILYFLEHQHLSNIPVTSNEDLIWSCSSHSRPHFRIDKKNGQTYFLHISNQKIDCISEDLDNSRSLVAITNFPFGPFASHREYYCWKNKNSDQDIDVIEFQSCDLRFKIQNNSIECENYPGYFIINPKDWQNKLGVDHLIVLVNQNGQEKVILRSGEMLTSADSVSQAFDPIVKPSAECSSCYYQTYDVLKTAGNRVFLNNYNPDSMLVLVHQLILKKRYRQAADYMSRIHFVKGVSDEALKIFEQIIQNEDKHPDAVLLKLRLALVYIKNRLFYKNLLWSEINEYNALRKLADGSLYAAYLKKKNNCHIPLLSEDEELDIINMIEGVGYQVEKEPDQKNNHSIILLPEIIQRQSQILKMAPKDEKSPIKPKLSFSKFIFPIFQQSLGIFNADLKATEAPVKSLNSPLSIKTKGEFVLAYQTALLGTKESKDALRNKLDLMDLRQSDPFYFSVIRCALMFPFTFSLFLKLGPPIEFEDYNGLKGFFNFVIHNVSKIKRIPLFVLSIISNFSYAMRMRTFDGITTSIQLTDHLVKSLEAHLPKKDSVPGTICLPVKENLLQAKTDLSIDEILQKCNRYPENASAKLNALSGELKPVSWDEATQLFLYGQEDLYKRRNPYLSSDEIKEIDALIGYQMAQTMSDPLGQRQYSTDLAPEIVRAFLVFENRNHIILREQQIQALVEFAKRELGDQVLSKQGTGSGKSKVQYPLLQFLRQRSQPTLNIWPKPLFCRNRDDMNELVKNSFDQMADTFPFNRQFHLDASTLRAFNRALYLGAKKAHQFNSTMEHVQSSELTLIEYLFNASCKLAEQDEPLFIELRNTQLLLRGMGQLVDESHSTQNPKREVNYSIGKSTAEPTEYIKTLADIFRFLLREDKLDLEANRQYLATEETYIEVTNDLAGYLQEVYQIPNDKRVDFKRYLTDLNASAPEWMAAHSEKEKMVLARGFICRLMRDSFQNSSVGVNYGTIDPTILKGPAIPYAGNNAPLKNSEYDITYETLVKTFHTYIHKKIDVNTCLEFVKHMQNNALNEMKILGLDCVETESYRRFESFRTNNIGNLFEINEHSTEALTILSQSNQFIIDYVASIVAPTVEKYQKKLRSTAQNARSQFNGMTTMSATPGHKQIYAPNVYFHNASKESDKKIEARITEICQDSNTLHCIPIQSPTEMLDHLISIILDRMNRGHDFRMLIDTGVLLKGLNNTVVANELLKKLPPNPFKGILFFDDNDELVVLSRGEKHPVAFCDSPLSKEDLFTYCDHQHIFGADTKQTNEAVGLCTFDKQTSWDDTKQGAGRLRGILESQKIEFVFTEAFRSLVSNQQEMITIEDLKKHGKQIGKIEEDELIFRAVKQQMHNEIRSRVMDKIIQVKSLKEALDLFKSFYKVLVEESPNTPWDHYGEPAIEIDRKEALLNYQAYCIELAHSLTALNQNEKELIESELKQYTPLIAKLEFTTKTRESIYTCESQSEVQKEVESFIQVEQESFIDHQLRLSKRNEAIWPEKIDFYKDDWITQYQLTSLFNKIIEPLIQLVFRAINLTIDLTYKLRDRCKMIEKKFDDFSSKYPNLSSTVWFVASLIATVVLFTFTEAILFPLIDLFIPFFVPGLAVSLAIGGIILGYRFVLKAKLDFKIQSIPSIIENHSNVVIRCTAPMFSDSKNQRLLATSNFIPIHDLIPFTPFGIEQKEAFNVLVIKEKGQWTMIFGDQTSDVSTWKERLPKQVASGLASDRKVFIYDLKLNTISLDGPKITYQDELENDQAFQALIVKAKLINGDLHFKPNQEKIIQSQLKTIEDVKILETFIQEILLVHEHKRKDYIGSSLEILIRKQKAIFSNIK